MDSKNLWIIVYRKSEIATEGKREENEMEFDFGGDLTNCRNIPGCCSS